MEYGTSADSEFQKGILAEAGKQCFLRCIIDVIFHFTENNLHLGEL